MKELKKQEQKAEQADKFELKYKKIKFFEKKKVIKRLEQIKFIVAKGDQTQEDK